MVLGNDVIKFSKVQGSGMTKPETIFVAVTLFIIFAFSFVNLKKGEVLARDVQRKNDLKHIDAALNDYLKDNVGYPPSKDGKIMACGNPAGSQPCGWGQDGIGSYIQFLPRDPSWDFDYVYLSDTRNFQLLAHLERKDDDEYNGKVEARKINCGKGVCNFAIADGKTPVDRDLSEIKDEK